MPTSNQNELSNTVAIRQATLIYVRQNLTNYREEVDFYIEAVLEHIAEGQAYTDKTPQALEENPNKQAEKIIQQWRGT